MFHTLSPHSITHGTQQGLQTRGLWLEVLRLRALRGLEVCPELVHVFEGLGEEGPAGVDLHQGQVVQLKQKSK